MRRSQRVLIVVLAAGLAAVVVLALVSWTDMTRPVLREVSIPVPGLTREVMLLHVSDVHGRSFGPDQRQLETLLGERHFDAAVLTGDLAGDDELTQQASRQLVSILARHSDGVFAVHGNHEAADNVEALQSLGVVDLSVRAEPATIAPDAGRVAVIGTLWSRYSEPLDEHVLVTISHMPPTADEVAITATVTAGERVFLAGHTHGGQIRIPFVGAVWAPPALSPLYEQSSLQGDRSEWFPELRGRHVAGLYRVGDAWVNVSAGLGTERIPVRLFNPAEMTVVHLIPGKPASN